MAVSDDWQENLETILRESVNIINNVKDFNFKKLNLKNVLTLIGLTFTGVKVVYMGWQVFSALKNYGVAPLARPNLPSKYGEWAVVTGAEYGIGQAYMKELASCGLNIIIISHDPKHVRATAIYLQEKYPIKIHIADIDFSQCSTVYEQIQSEIEDKEIGILVNNLNLNYDIPEYFTDVDSETVRQMLHCNIVAVTMTTHMVLPQMVERGKGAIVIIGSSLTNIPTPQLAIFGATKAYMDFFAETINMENKEKGITVQVLQPLLVAGSHENALHTSNLLVPSASTYAHQAISTLGWSHRTSGCISHTIQNWVSSFVPKPIFQWVISGVTALIKNQAMKKLGINDDKSNVQTSSLFIDSNFMLPQSLLNFLGNSG